MTLIFSLSVLGHSFSNLEPLTQYSYSCCVSFCVNREQGGEETWFKVKKTTRLEKMFNMYATRKDVPVSSFSFRFDGRRLNNDDTPVTLELEHLDQIDCLPEGQASDATPLVQQSLTTPRRPSVSRACLSPGYEGA